MSYPVRSRSNRSDPDRSLRAQPPPLGRKRSFRTAARERTIAALRRLVARVEGQAFCLIEIKHDGFRLLARRGVAGVRLFTRNGHAWTERFPLCGSAERTQGDDLPDGRRSRHLYDTGLTEFEGLRSP